MTLQMIFILRSHRLLNIYQSTIEYIIGINRFMQVFLADFELKELLQIVIPRSYHNNIYSYFTSTLCIIQIAIINSVVKIIYNDNLHQAI